MYYNENRYFCACSSVHCIQYIQYISLVYSERLYTKQKVLYSNKKFCIQTKSFVYKTKRFVYKTSGFVYKTNHYTR